MDVLSKPEAGSLYQAKVKIKAGIYAAAVERYRIALFAEGLGYLTADEYSRPVRFRFGRTAHLADALIF